MDQVRLAENHKEETIEGLHSFDRSETNRLLPVEQDVVMLRRVVSEMNGMFQSGELNPAQYNPGQLATKLSLSMPISQLGKYLSQGVDSVTSEEKADEVRTMVFTNQEKAALQVALLLAREMIPHDIGHFINGKVQEIGTSEEEREAILEFVKATAELKEVQDIWNGEKDWRDKIAGTYGLFKGYFDKSQDTAQVINAGLLEKIPFIGDELAAQYTMKSNFKQGAADSFLFGIVEGLGTVIGHPVETLQSVGNAILNPVETGKAAWDAISSSFTEKVTDGDLSSRSEWAGSAAAEIGGLFVGIGAVKKATTAADLAKKKDTDKDTDKEPKPKVNDPSIPFIPNIWTAYGALKWLQDLPKVRAVQDSTGGTHLLFETKGRDGGGDAEGTGNGGRIPNKITSTPELEEHLKYREYVDENGKKHKNKKGIVGAHNSDEFFKNDVLIRSENKVYDINGNEVKGVRQIEYSMPEIDGKTEKPTGNYNQSTNTKTIYDPNIISDREYVDRGIEAVNNALEKEPSGVLPHTWTGVDSKGVTWLGYYKNGKVTSFFPTSP